MISENLTSEISRSKRIVVTGLSFTTAICASLHLLAWAFVIAQVLGGVYDSPILLFAVAVFTFVPAVVCTFTAILLVGFRRCRFAWVSLCTFPLPFFLAMGIAAILALVEKI